MRNLLRRLARRNLVMVISCALILAGFQFLLCAIVASTNVSGALEQLMAFTPPIFQSMISGSMLAGGDAALLAFGWNHPVTHALGSAVAITLGARAIAGEVEHGAIELVLAQPISRTAYLTAQMLFALLAISAIAGLGVLATLIGQHIFDLEPFPATRLLALLLTFVLLQGALFAVTLAFSSFGREGGRVAFAGVLVALVSYLLQAVAALWPRIAGVGPYSLHYYYDPRQLLVNGRLDPIEVAVLVGVLVVASGVAFYRFGTRDLP